MIDFIGLAPGFGDVADGLNAVISYSRGNYFDAILSVGCIVFSAVADVVLKPLKWAAGTVVEKVKKISDKIDGFLPAIRNFISGISNKIDNMLFGFKKAKAKVIEMCDNFVAYLNDLSFQINDQYAYAGIPDDYFDDVAEKSIIKESGEITKKILSEIEVKFNYKIKFDRDEFARQLANQEAGMNKLTVYEYLKNREKFLKEGRAIESNMAQQAAREKAFSEKVLELRGKGLTNTEAEAEAKKWIKNLVALHDPDQVAGGYFDQINGLGDKAINSSIGAQWKYRIDQVDDKVKEMSKKMTNTEKKNTYLNVRLIF